MALEHDFYLISKPTDVRCFWQHTSDNSKQHVILNDDFIQYITDTLKWIPTKKTGIHAITAEIGINYHGVTLLDKQSAVPFDTVTAFQTHYFWQNIKHSVKKSIEY